MKDWIFYIGQFFIIAFAVVWCIDLIRKNLRLRKAHFAAATAYAEAARPPTALLVPPPTPIDRNEFLQARMAYVAHLRDVGIEVDEGQDKGEKLPSGKRIIRPAKPEEMIELVNLRDEGHLTQIFATWDEVQVKQREQK